MNIINLSSIIPKRLFLGRIFPYARWLLVVQIVKLAKNDKTCQEFFSTVVEYSCSPGCCGISWLGQDLLHDSSPSFQLFTQDDLNYSKRIASSIYHRHSLSSILLLAIFRSLPCSTDMRALKTKMRYKIQTLNKFSSVGNWSIVLYAFVIVNRIGNKI